MTLPEYHFTSDQLADYIDKVRDAWKAQNAAERKEAQKREYSRGYQRGRNRAHDYAAFAFRIAKQFREQAADLRRVMLGKDNWTNRECQTCDRWTRGQPGNCKWGICSAEFMTEVGEPMMWVDGGGTFTTHEDFGCCNHLHPKHPFRGSASK